MRRLARRLKKWGFDCLEKDGEPVTMRTEEEQQLFAGYRRAIIKGEIKFSQMLEKKASFSPEAVCATFRTGLLPNLCPCAMMYVSL